MADFPSTTDLTRIARDEMLLKNTALTRDVLERAGSDANALAAAGVAVGDAVVGQLIRVAAGLNSDSAKGDDLRRLYFDRYQLVQKDAAPARGSVQLTTTAPTAASFAIPTGTKFRASDGKLFQSTADRVFPASSSGPVDVPVTSLLSGADQQARAHTITSLADTLPGTPAAGVLVDNASATAGADDAEGEEAFRARGKLFYKTARRGTLSAIEAGALAVPGVRTARAFVVVNPDGSAARLVELVVADAFTEQLLDTTTIPNSYQTQSAVLKADVLAALDDVSAAGIQVLVTTANVVLLGVTLGLRFRAGVDVAATSDAARAVVVSYVNSLAPGASFVAAALDSPSTGLLGTVPGLQVLGGEVLAPTVDQTPSPTQVFRTSLALVVATVQS